MGGWNSAGEVAGSVRAALAIAAALAFSGAGAATLGRFQLEGGVAKTSLALDGQARISLSATRMVDIAGRDPAGLAVELEMRVTRHDGVTGPDSLKYFRNGRLELRDSTGRKVFQAASPVQSGVKAAERTAGEWMRVSFPLDKLEENSGRLGAVVLFDYNDIPKQAERTGVTVEVRNARIECPGEKEDPEVRLREAREELKMWAARRADPSLFTKASYARYALAIDGVKKALAGGAGADAALTAAKAARAAWDALELADDQSPRFRSELARKTKAVENPKPRTVCNPIDLEYMIQRGKKRKDGTVGYVNVESADPALAVFKGEYWLFASHGDGYWHSRDLADWKFVRVDVTKPVLEEFKRYAPATCVIGDTLYLCHSEGGRMLKTTDPGNPAAWEDVSKPDGWMDPGMLYDDPAEGGDGYVYLYRGLTHRGPIEVLRLDPKDGMKKVAGPFDCAWPDKFNRGYEVSGDDNTNYDGNDTQEGAWPVKYNGRYYLTCAVPGTQFATYADNCYVSDSPTGPFTFCDNSPVAWKPTGFTQGAGHGCLFKDLKGRWWKVDTCRVRGFTRRLVLLPAMFDAKGDLYTNTLMSDYPFYVPEANPDPFNAPGPGWGLLSGGKHATASSNAGAASLAFNESMADSWVADTAEPGEWLQVDLGRLCAVWSVQVNFDDQKCTVGGRDEDFAYRYVLEFSQDGRRWFTLLDRTRQTVNRQHEYVEFADKVGARYIRYTNKGSVPGNGQLAISGLRVFGEAGGRPPAGVDLAAVAVDRRAENNRTAAFEWEPAPGARGYFVRYGTAPDRLYTHFQVIGANALLVNSLNRGVDYWFTIDSYNENGVTPGARALPLRATAPRIDGCDVDGDNPAFVNRVAGVEVFEAERARFGGGAVASRYEARASGAYALHGLGGAGTFAEFANVRATAGAAKLRVCYSAIADACAEVSVNGGAATKLELPKTRGWPTFRAVDLPLADVKAVNTVRIGGAGGPFLLDWIQLLPADTPAPEKGGR